MPDQNFSGSSRTAHSLLVCQVIRYSDEDEMERDVGSVEPPAITEEVPLNLDTLCLIPDEKRLSGHGVSWCATCDGFFFRDQDIAVVGGGDSALEEATFLSRFASKVHVIHRRDELRASKVMQERAFNDPKITFEWDSEVVGISGEDKVSGVRLADTNTGEQRDLAITGLFIAIGHDPRSELVRDQVSVDAEGYVVVHAPSTRTNVEGVFAAGDLVDHTYRQAVTAAGTGCAAALDAERFLATLADHASVVAQPVTV